MNIETRLGKISSLFIDTAPFIYYIEGNNNYTNITTEIINTARLRGVKICTSVLTVSEILVKPVELKKVSLANELIDFFHNPDNLSLIEINFPIAEKAGKLRGKYHSLKTIDALQIASAINCNIDMFLTNDKRLKKVKEIKSWVLDDLL